MRTGAKVATGVVAALAAAYVAERVAVARIRRRPAPAPIPAGWRPPGDHVVVAGHDGAALHAVVAGSGPPLVLAHGVMLSTEIWALLFEPLVEQGFRVIAYDQRGHGRSTVGRSGFSGANLAHDLRAVLEACDAQDGLVVGHSMGGLSVLSLVAEHPDTARRLAGTVLVATTPATYRVPLALADRAAAAAGRPFVGRALASPLHGTALTRVGFGPRSPGDAVEHARRILAGTPAATVAAANRALVGLDYTGLLPGLGVPALVVAGRRDRVVPPVAARLFAAGLGEERVVELDAGHMLPLEAAPELLALIASFAAELGLVAGHT